MQTEWLTVYTLTRLLLKESALFAQTWLSDYPQDTVLVHLTQNWIFDEHYNYMYKQKEQTVDEKDGEAKKLWRCNCRRLMEPRHEKTCLCHMWTTKA